jgi:hypothetical protein
MKELWKELQQKHCSPPSLQKAEKNLFTSFLRLFTILINYDMKKLIMLAYGFHKEEAQQGVNARKAEEIHLFIVQTSSTRKLKTINRYRYR